MHTRVALPLAIMMIAAASCGGGDSGNADNGAVDTGSPSGDATADGTTDDGTVQSDSEGQPINGVLFSLLSPELGLYAIDRDNGEVRDLTMGGVGFTDRQKPPVLVGDAAYTLTATPIEGQLASHEVGLGKIDLPTGAGSEITVIGTDRKKT